MLPTIRLEDCNYQACFCEENVWHLLHSTILSERKKCVIFISNPKRQVAVWSQRAAKNNDFVIWDYHVVLLLPSEGVIIDLDDCEKTSWQISEWLHHAFREDIQEQYMPMFRVIAGDEFILKFSTDRSHMTDKSIPHPKWSPPFNQDLGMNLMRFVDVLDPIAGIVVNKSELIKIVSSFC